ncbi:MAG: exo-alpha-sialidase, partial [Armatimonadetes bacterium]|nr:exo-alpha-sialidase [Armatimonadota bacterium]
GLTYDEPRPWTFDDGEELGNYNTQQHWVTHSERLHLVYTRRGLNNDHVFRHRAPLVMAEVDPERLCVLRDTERVIIPERGARLGNFAVTDVSPQETWVTVSEWMQTWGPNPYDYTICQQYGSDNAVFAGRIVWERGNLSVRG